MDEQEQRYRVQSIRFNVACLMLIVLYLVSMLIAEDYRRKANELKEARLNVAAQPEEAQPEEEESEDHA